MKRRALALFLSLIMTMTMIAGVIPSVSADQGDITLRVHYHRPDGDYDGWELWAWDPDAISDMYPPYQFVDEGDGDMVATVYLRTGTTSVGYIIRYGEWIDKDVAEDQFIDISGVLSGTLDLYVESGVPGGTLVKGDDVEEGIVIIDSVYKEENRNGRPEVTILISDELPYSADFDTFKIVNRDGQVGVISLRRANNYYYLELEQALDLSRSYSIEFEGRSYVLEMPDYYSSDEFETRFTYTGNDLGATYSREKTILRVWAPTAFEVQVALYRSGDVDAESTPYDTVAMTKDVNGTWVATLNGDWDGTYYTYIVTTDIAVKEACDPYARATGVNGDRAMIIDLDATDPEGWGEDKAPHAGLGYTDAIIYELHVRDATMDGSSGIRSDLKGKYLGLIQAGTKTSGGIGTVLDHMVDLGITHVHLLPVFDFNSVDETRLDDPKANHYSWGYEPKNFNVPEGSYATDPYAGEVRVKEFKQMVKGMHDAGLSVIMDVVYNHVADSRNFCVNRIVEGYFSRPESNGSGCGNDTASERAMVSKYIVDSVNYWADEYHIDGFRFDLAGLLDVDTINKIVETVHAKHPSVIFYGEGWSMSTNWTKSGTMGATQYNSPTTPGMAYYSDDIRNTIKGSTYGGVSAGFISGAYTDASDLYACFKGLPAWSATPSQTVNYISSHELNTLFDHIGLAAPHASEGEKASMNKLGAAFVLASQGIPFFPAGEEFLRSKPNGDGTFNDNSYNAGDGVNSLKWSDLEKSLNKNVYEYYKGLIAFRKAHPALRYSTVSQVDTKIKRLSTPNDRIAIYRVDDIDEQILTIFNSDSNDAVITLPEGRWSIYVNADKAGVSSLGTVSGTVTVDKYSAMFLVGSPDGSSSRPDEDDRLSAWYPDDAEPSSIPDGYVRAHVWVPAKWERPYIYTWVYGAEGELPWPGRELVKESEDWYTALIPVGEDQFVISDDGLYQTADLAYDGSEREIWVVVSSGDDGQLCGGGVYYDTCPTPEIEYCYSKKKNSVRVQWTAVDGVDGYEIRRSTTPDDPLSFEVIKTIYDPTVTTYTNTSLTEGVTYYYRVQSFVGTDPLTRLRSEISGVDYIPAAAIFNEPYSNSSFRIRLRWYQVEGADGYQIWRKEVGGSYKVAKTIREGDTIAYSNVSLTAGQKYVYKMRAFYLDEDGDRVYGAYSDEVTVGVQPVAPAVSAVSSKAGQVKITWERAFGADSYQIWMSDSPNGTYRIVKSVSDGDTTSYTKKSLESGKTYYFKVRACLTVDGKRVFGAYSRTISVTIE